MTFTFVGRQSPISSRASVGPKPSPFTRLRISGPADPHEREAERVAVGVTHGGTAGLHPTRATSGAADAPPPIVHDVLRSPGQPLDASTRGFMEHRLGHDFGRVRVHVDGRAAESAEAVRAFAYTVGNHIVFGTGQYAPGTSHGKSVLAHELAHVVQQPAGVLSRLWKDPESVWKKMARGHHENQQRLVAGFLKSAVNLPADPKNPLNPDNLYRNTAELIERPKGNRKILLSILTPTDYSRPGRLVFFDTRVHHPNIGGDYPPDPDPKSPNPVAPGLDTAPLETEARASVQPPPPQISSITTMPKAPEVTDPARTVPPTPPAVALAAPWSWSPGEIRIFFRHLDQDLTDGKFRSLLVHEGQHILDLSDRSFKSPAATNASKVLEHYKSEFRAFWIQPPPPRESALGLEAVFTLPEPTRTSTQLDVSVVEPPPCTLCPPDKIAAGAKASPKNGRQAVILSHLMKSYPHFSCFYVCDAAFRKEVDDFAFPSSVNLVNSPRLLDVNVEMQALGPGMKPAEVATTPFAVAVLSLDAVDWAILAQADVSKAFWNDLAARAPRAVVDAMKASAKIGKAKQPALNKALGR